MRGDMKKYLIVAGLSATLLACSPNVETRGHVRTPDWQQTIKPGQSTREDVAALMGSPSTISSFGDEVWYYMSAQRESIAFLKPEVADQEIIRIAFSPDGLVQQTGVIGKDGLKEIQSVKRETPTEGHEMTVLEQMVGNLGRFNSNSANRNRGVSPTSRGVGR